MDTKTGHRRSPDQSPYTTRRTAARWVAVLGSWLLVWGLTQVPVQGVLHLWGISEIYSNEDGSVQFIEFEATSDSQEFIEDSELISGKQDGSDSNSFTFPENSPSPTGGRSLLMATPGFADLPGGVEPDFTIPEGFIFVEEAFVEFPPSDLSNGRIEYDTLPTDGVRSLGPDGVNEQNSPQNFAGDEGSLSQDQGQENQPPSVSIVSPSDGQEFAPGASVLIEAEATDEDGEVVEVEFFDGDSSLGAATESPFSIEAEFESGEHTLTATATDDQDATAGSDEVTILVTEPSGPLAITGTTIINGIFELQWEGGTGPYSVQQKTRVNDETWTKITTDAAQAAEVPRIGPHGWFQVVDESDIDAVPLTAHLSGDLARPDPVETDGTGTATLSLEGDRLIFNVHYTGLTGPATDAHIHGPATADEAAGVMIGLGPFNGEGFGESGTLAGSVTVTPEQREAILAGETYINIHTEQNPPGEIRGQIVPVLMQSSLSGDAVRPEPVETDGTGTAHLTLVHNELTLNLTYSGLSGSATAAHIHGPADTEEAADILIDLEPFNGEGFGQAGSLQGTVTLEPDQWAALVDGRTYIDIHTESAGASQTNDENGGGGQGLYSVSATPQQDGSSPEIRGQLRPQTDARPATAWISGEAARPDPIETDGHGSGTFAIEGETLHFDIHYAGLTGPATDAHIHGRAPASETAGVMIGLEPFNGEGFGESGTLSGEVSLTPEQKAAIVAGETYVNIHTEAHPGGEIRGQIAPVLMKASFSGANARPDPIETRGEGFGLFSLVRDRLAFNMTYGRLTGPATNAHIHAPAPRDENAGVAVGLEPFNGTGFDVTGSFAGAADLSPEQLRWIIDGLGYVNIHTEQNQPGEIRGQVTR